MANPQKENGHTGIANEIIEALAKTRIPGEAMQVLWVIFRKTYGWDKIEDWISLGQFSKLTGLHKQTVFKAIKKLQKMNIVTKKGDGVTKKGDAQKLTYSFNKDYETWKPLPKKVTSPLLVTGGNPKRLKGVTQKDTHNNTNTTDTNTTIMSKSAKKSDLDVQLLDWKINKVHEWYCQIIDHDPKRYQLTPARQKKIVARLKEFSVYELWAAINAVSWDDWAMGRNPKTNGKKFNDLVTNILDSYELTEKWLNIFIDNQGGRGEIDKYERELEARISTRKTAGENDLFDGKQPEPKDNPGAKRTLETNETDAAPIT